MNIVITTALPPEFNAARNALGLEEYTKKGELPRIAERGNISLILTSMGRDNAYKYLSNLLEKRRVDLVIDTGTCGSLIDDIDIGDIVFSQKVLTFDSSLQYEDVIESSEPLVNELIGSRKVGCVSSVDKSITATEDRILLRDSGADIVTWETAGVFSAAKKHSIPFFSIRGVTDRCNGETFMDFKKNRVEVCKKLYNSVKILCKGI